MIISLVSDPIALENSVSAVNMFITCHEHIDDVLPFVRCGITIVSEIVGILLQNCKDKGSTSYKMLKFSQKGLTILNKSVYVYDKITVNAIVMQLLFSLLN
ncbi:MAG: hypothetical protein LBL41_02930 [Bifidobacteriaceae bacterium]|jgi:hypothetical protein|nr:hypothetical protein [Bifidobacteriaceae bacterium]